MLKNVIESLNEGLFDSNLLKKLKRMYIEFNKVEDSILHVVNSTNGSDYIDTPAGYDMMLQLLKGNVDGITLAKKQEERIKKIHKLAKEILKLDEDLKEDLNNFVGEHYSKEFKKLN